MPENNKTLVQCDFDGTITVDDISFAILDKFGQGDWRKLFKDYEDGKITVGRFNTLAFSTITADKKTQLEVVKAKGKLRPGLKEMVDACRRKDFRFVIVSNGLRFYIDEMLESAGLGGLEVRAAESRFSSKGMQVQYIGPDGKPLDSDFKLAYNRMFREQGYRIIYAGNGSSDFPPARQSQHIFATSSLLKRCVAAKVDCTPFTDLHEIARVIETL